MSIALAALVLALPAALFVAWPLLRRGGGAGPAAGDERREALEAEKLLTLRAIRELELDRQAGLLAEDDYAELRARYEGRASAVLHQLDALPAPVPAAKPAPAAAPAGAAPAPAAVPWTLRPLVLTGGALGLLVFGVVLGVLVVRFTGPAPPDPMAVAPPPMANVPGVGAVPPGEGGGSTAEAGPPRPIPPGMLQGMLSAAHQSLDAGRYQEAIAAYKAVLKREPQNVDAITHLGIILAVAGHAEPALEAFDRALAIQPDYAHALWDKARVLYEQRQDYAGAIAAWERFLAVSGPGEDRERAQALIREARAKQAGAPVGPAGVKR